MKTKLTDQNVVEAFPEEQGLVLRKLAEYWEEAAELYKTLIEIRRRVDRIQTDPFSKWFYLRSRDYDEGRRLRWLQEQITRLERLKVTYEKKSVEKHLSKEYFKTIKERERFDIDKMFSREELLVDIVSYYGIKLQRSGSIFKIICPFHTEKTASCYIYKDNWFHCFGCQSHGNFLDFIIKEKNLTFREALEEANKFL